MSKQSGEALNHAALLLFVSRTVQSLADYPDDPLVAG